MPTTNAAIEASEPRTTSKNHPGAQHQVLRVFDFCSKSWTPEAITGIVFGILMFLLGVAALLKTRGLKLINMKDIESLQLSRGVPCSHLIKKDPSLWLPPYEPPQDFVCIADPPDTYTNPSLPGLCSKQSKKPTPKPQPVTKPPKPRDGYELEADLGDIVLDSKDQGILLLGDQGPKKPVPKPQPDPKPPQPRDGYDFETDLTDTLSNTKNNESLVLGDQGPKKPAPKPKPPQPRDGYATLSSSQ